jgi:hypothetical protein
METEAVVCKTEDEQQFITSYDYPHTSVAPAMDLTRSTGNANRSMLVVIHQSGSPRVKISQYDATILSLVLGA